EAVAGLRDRGVDAVLTLVGPLDHPEYHVETMALAERLGVADRVRVEGYQSDPLPYVERADVALMLSRSEAFGRVTLEYLALGTPVVGIGAGGTTELIADGSSGFVTGDDVEGIVDALERYATEEGLLEEHRARAADDATAIAGRYPLGPVIEAVTEVARTAPRVPKLPHLMEFWLGLGDDVDRMRAEWEQDRNPRLGDTLREFEEARRRTGRGGSADAVAEPAPLRASDSGSDSDSASAEPGAALAELEAELPEPPPATIVVPIYGDLESLEACILSLIEHGELDRNRALLVNDCGPQADLIEARVLELIDGVAGIVYARNERNLGFGATCNRAVTELDDTGNDVLLLNSDAVLTAGAVRELQTVLHLAEKHGVVCPRSNNATIASFPFMPRPLRGPHHVEHSLRRYATLVDELPRYTVAPVALGFCFLVRRSLIENFGLFDEIYSPGYGEENDFCFRVNAYGYSSVFANHSYVIHEGSRSFRESAHDPDELHVRNELVLHERYPHFEGAVQEYLEHDIDPIDWFADFLDPRDPHKRVLIDLYDLTLRYDGTSRNALSFLTLLAARKAAGELGDTEFVIASSIDAVAFFGLDGYGFRTLWNQDVNELFDLGFALVPVTTQAQIERLDRFCARWVVTHLDMIGTRVLAIRQHDTARKQVLRDSFVFADRTVMISEATRRDTLAYFPELPASALSRITVVPQGASALTVAAPDAALTPRQRAAVAAGGYVLVVGNSFAHKQLPETVAALSGGSRTVVVFGSPAPDEGGRVVPIAGGLLSDAQVSRLYAQAAVVVFPSTYEGFGLPIAEAAQRGKPVVVFDTAVSREVVAELGLADSTRSFSHFSELPAAVEAAIAAGSASNAVPVRTLDEYNAALIDVIVEELAKPVDLARLRARVTHFRAVKAYSARVQEYLAEAAHFIEATANRRSYRVLNEALERVARLRRAAAALRRRLPGGLGR
ncbi:MAG: glycosyltransferase, partial [Herbiconiux sp.]|nr:glycosyltransferase [Herbiconiux sp.]